MAVEVGGERWDWELRMGGVVCYTVRRRKIGWGGIGNDWLGLRTCARNINGQRILHLPRQEAIPDNNYPPCYPTSLSFTLHPGIKHYAFSHPNPMHRTHDCLARLPTLAQPSQLHAVLELCGERAE
jgi:hypothetical protein